MVMGMASDLYIQISIEYGKQRRVRYRHLLEPYQGQHDPTTSQLPDTPLTLHLYWCPGLPSEDIHELLLPGLEQFIRRIIAELRLLKPLESPVTTERPHYQEIYNVLTQQTYIYRDGEWVSKEGQYKLLPLSLTNGR